MRLSDRDWQRLERMAEECGLSRTKLVTFMVNERWASDGNEIVT